MIKWRFLVLNRKLLLFIRLLPFHPFVTTVSYRRIVPKWCLYRFFCSCYCYPIITITTTWLSWGSSDAIKHLLLSCFKLTFWKAKKFGIIKQIKLTGTTCPKEEIPLYVCSKIQYYQQFLQGNTQTKQRALLHGDIVNWP